MELTEPTCTYFVCIGKALASGKAYQATCAVPSSVLAHHASALALTIGTIVTMLTIIDITPCTS